MVKVTWKLKVHEEKDMEALRSTIQTMESDVYTEVKELVSLKQEQQRFKEAADSEHHTLQALTEKILRAEESAAHLPEEIRRLRGGAWPAQGRSLRPEEDGAFRPPRPLKRPKGEPRLGLAVAERGRWGAGGAGSLGAPG